jgi:ribose transport system substrate-binding protein
VAAAKAVLATDYKGTDAALPSSAPKPATGKNVWVISCLQAGAGCAIPAEGVVQAGKALGWHVNVFDGKASPATESQGIKTALSDHADAIVLDFVDCPGVQGALKAAKAAGVPVFGIASAECPGEKLITAQTLYANGDFSNHVQTEEAAVANYVIAKTDGKAKIIEITEDDVLGPKTQYTDFQNYIAKHCSTCTIVKKVPIVLSQLVNGQVQAAVATAITQEPTANVVYVPYDALVTAGAAQAVAASGHASSLIVTGLEGFQDNINLIKTGKGQTMAAGQPALWLGWAAADGLVRLFAKQPQVAEGIGIQVVDKQHNVPATTPYYNGNVTSSGQPKTQWQANFLKIWGKK